MGLDRIGHRSNGFLGRWSCATFSLAGGGATSVLPGFFLKPLVLPLLPFRHVNALEMYSVRTNAILVYLLRPWPAYTMLLHLELIE